MLSKDCEVVINGKCIECGRMVTDMTLKEAKAKIAATYAPMEAKKERKQGE